MGEFAVHIEVFEGPLDLLLTLVRKESLDISTVALGQVTEQYLTYLGRLEEIDPGALAEFCEVAATLIVLKSRALLPRPAERLDDEEDDPDELAARLRAYRRYREVADELGQRERRGLRAYVRTAAAPPELPPRLEPADVSPAALADAFRAALASVPAPPEAAEDGGVKPHVVRIRDRLAAIRSALEHRGRVSFLEVLTDGARTREFVIVSFLAVLELLRRGAVRVLQDDLFGDIYLETSDTFAGMTVDEPTFLDEPEGAA